MTNTGCAGFGVIYGHRDDTVETQRQIFAHNLTYKALCQQERTDG